MANVMTKPGSIGPTEQEAEIVKLSQAVKEKLAPTVSLVVDGVSATQPQVAAKLDAFAASHAAVHDARQALQAALKARDAASVEAREYCKGLKAAVKQQLGRTNPELAAFGISPDKPLVRTTKDLIVASAKAQQTRQVRGTLGKRQRAQIKVVGDPPVHLASDGSMTSGPPPVRNSAAKKPSPRGSGTRSAT